MECILEANPVPDILWYQGSKLILDSDRMRMTKTALGKDSYSLKLEISNPTQQDGGGYRCNACNIYGESNANISLNFQGTGHASSCSAATICRLVRVRILCCIYYVIVIIIITITPLFERSLLYSSFPIAASGCYLI